MTILDCHHNDITHIVELRLVARYDRKTANLVRYRRRYARRGSHR